MPVTFRSQTIAKAAFARVESRMEEHGNMPNPGWKLSEYLSFSRSFPTLVHTSGLAQASAFCLAKQDPQVLLLEDVAAVVSELDRSFEIEEHRLAESIQECARTAKALDYIRLSRNALNAATWVKRYAEALIVESSRDGELT